MYEFPTLVQLQPHTLRLRPLESHELRIEKSRLRIEPTATLRWQQDVEGNSVATASFALATQSLWIESEIITQQFNQAPHDFLVADHAVNYPFYYTEDEKILLQPYMQDRNADTAPLFNDFVASIWNPNEITQSFSLLLRINQRVNQQLDYCIREEAGVQTPEESLEYATGSCRDSATLFMAVAQRLGFAARFVSGYIYSNTLGPGSTHAWAEVFLPGAGWKGFDPTTGGMVGAEHIPVAVARLPESVPPISGSYKGPPGAVMKVNVSVDALSDSAAL